MKWKSGFNINPLGDPNQIITTDYVFDSHGKLTQEIRKPANPDAQSDSSWLTTAYLVNGRGQRVKVTSPDSVKYGDSHPVLRHK